MSVSTSPTFKAGKALRDAVKAGPGVRTLQGQPTATRSASDSLIMEPARLLYDDGHFASCQCAAGKTQESRGVDGWSATSLDSSSRRRQEDRRCRSDWSWAITATEGRDVGITPLRSDDVHWREPLRVERRPQGRQRVRRARPLSLRPLGKTDRNRALVERIRMAGRRLVQLRSTELPFIDRSTGHQSEFNFQCGGGFFVLYGARMLP